MVKSHNLVSAYSDHISIRVSIYVSIYAVFTLCLLLFCTTPARAEPSLLGQTGLINMPDARIEETGTLRFGYAYYEPYPTLWSTISMFSRLEFGARYTRFMHVTAFEGEGYGDSKDKAFDAKLTLLKESKYLPQFSIGVQDFLGTQLLKADYVALNKHFGGLDITLGYGRYRIDGAFGGLRYNPQWLKGFGFVAEYDAFDYKKDPYADQSRVDEKKAGGPTYGIEYQWGWLGSQVSYQDGEWGANGYISIPLDKTEFIPKVDEAPPFTEQVYRPTIEQWQQDPQYRKKVL